MDQLQVLQEKFDDGSIHMAACLTKDIVELWGKEEAYWAQRSRINWLQKGDSNSKFFHLTTIQRRQRNKVLRIKKNDDSWLDNEHLIRSKFEAYFKNIFTSESSRDWSEAISVVKPIISPEMNQNLTLPISHEEIKEASFHMGADKAASPYGFHGLFYQKFWNITNEIIVGTAKDFFSTGTMVAELNMTNIVLIPKVPNPEMVSQLRPISLCNYSYKILSKILANRLKGILPEIISSFRSVFVPGRQIQDNILIAHEAFHYLKLKKPSKFFELALKLDMSKAYDRVE
ncbi:hypothetical protein M0R45_006545 [Rubus argutus]|uniref:Reverse transcriptase domain-containing protein n=1 Tax=Rubus argutus TaxID=59490 RepID=A0AAW1YR31_RUBAR